MYCGNDDMILPAMALGARGAISVAANVIPAEMHAMTADWLRGEAKRCLEKQVEALPLIDALFSAVNPVPVKAACAAAGLCSPALRPPLYPAADALRFRLEEELRRADTVLSGIGL